PKEFMTTSNSVCSSAAAAASPPAPGAAATATGAAAETPHFSSSALTSSTTSMIDLLLNASINSSLDRAISNLLTVNQCVTYCSLTPPARCGPSARAQAARP